MRFSKLFIAVASVCLAGLVLAVPVPQSLSDDETALVERSLDASEYAIDLELRAPLSNAQRGRAAAQLVQKQHARKAAKNARKPANRAQAAADRAARPANRVAKKAARAARPKGVPIPRAQVRAAKNARKDARNPARATRRAGFAPASAAQKQAKAAAKAARRAARPAGVKGPARTPKTAPRMSAADKQAVKAHVKDSARKMQTMTNIPARGARLSYGSVSRSGRDIRQAAMNSHMHSASPVGGGPGALSVPANFQNRPYNSAGHPNHGQNPLPGSPAGRRNGLSEFPVKNSGAGYHGSGDKGKVRVITDNTANVFHGAVTHQPGRTPAPGTRRGDHFRMT